MLSLRQPTAPLFCSTQVSQPGILAHPASNEGPSLNLSARGNLEGEVMAELGPSERNLVLHKEPLEGSAGLQQHAIRALGANRFVRLSAHTHMIILAPNPGCPMSHFDDSVNPA